MASLFPVLLIQISWISFLLALIISPAEAASDCTSQTFTNNKKYDNCIDLPTLSAYLHWTYDASNSSLSIAFIAPPAKTDGWVSWGINPTGTKMVGSQALVAYKTQNGTPTVETFNITSYSTVGLVKGKLSFEVWDTSAEFSDGSFKIFAKVQAKAEKLNQVWQVGPGVDATTGALQPHDTTAQANRNAFGELNLLGTTNTTTNGTGTTNTTTNGTGTTNTTGSGNSGAITIRIGSGGINMGLLPALLLLVLGTLIVF